MKHHHHTPNHTRLARAALTGDVPPCASCVYFLYCKVTHSACEDFARYVGECGTWGAPSSTRRKPCQEWYDRIFDPVDREPGERLPIVRPPAGLRP